VIIGSAVLPSGMTLLKWLSFALCGYVVLVAALYFLQREFMYFPPNTHRIPPVDAGFPVAEEVVLATNDGEKVIAEERLLKNSLGRIRDVRNGPDGLLYLLVDDRNGMLVRLEPSPG